MKHALVVEGDFEQRCVLVRAVELCGARPDVAVGTAEARHALMRRETEGDRYDVVIAPIDYYLDALVDPVRRLGRGRRHREEGCSLFVATAERSDKARVLSAFRDGCDDVLILPLERDAVARALAPLFE